MPTRGELGYGAVLKVGATTAAVTATVSLAGITNLSPPSFTRDTVDVTHFGSADATREFIPALKDRGEVSLDLIWIPDDATDQVFVEMQSETESRLCEISFTQVGGAPTFTFLAFLTGYEPGVPLEDKMTATATLKVTGPVVIA